MPGRKRPGKTLSYLELIPAHHKAHGNQRSGKSRKAGVGLILWLWLRRSSLFNPRPAQKAKARISQSRSPSPSPITFTHSPPPLFAQGIDRADRHDYINKLMCKSLKRWHAHHLLLTVMLKVLLAVVCGPWLLVGPRPFWHFNPLVLSSFWPLAWC